MDILSLSDIFQRRYSVPQKGSGVAILWAEALDDHNQHDDDSRGKQEAEPEPNKHLPAPIERGTRRHL